MSHLFRSVPNTARVVAEAAHPWQGATTHDRDVAYAAIGIMLVSLGSDSRIPTEIVAAGPFAWRQAFMRGFRGYRLIDEGAADDCFPYFVQVHTARYPGLSAREVLDAWWEPAMITQAEIDAGWEIESESCEEARRYFYGDRDPRQVMAELNDPKAHDPIEVRL